MVGIGRDVLTRVLLDVQYFTFGDLRSFMRMCASCQFLEMMDIEQFDIARQIAAGMAYLSGHGFIHRDLAARNVLLGAAGRVAVADFGMSRRLDVNHDYYRVSSRGVKMPVRWMAIESLEFRKVITIIIIMFYCTCCPEVSLINIMTAYS